MSDIFYALLRPLLFSLPEELAHQVALSMLKAYALFGSGAPANEHPVSVMGLSFPNRVGLGAGFDKSAKALRGLSKLGFGFIEIGSVTPRPQIGNELPRLFRIPGDEAILNRMGFNNDGMMTVARRLSKRPRGVILGVNLGKNKDTSNENAISDYTLAFRTLAPFADYVTLNISSPNTPDLRDLQKIEHLQPLLVAIKKQEQLLFGIKKVRTPIVVKISPDESNDDIKRMLDLFLAEKIDGIIAGNTTLNKKLLSDPKWHDEAGGVSGKPLRARATEVVQLIAEHTHKALPIIASGGIFSVDDAKEKLDAGASLIQIYTGFIYQGPGLVKRLVKAL